MHPEQIKAALRMKGFTQAMLADELEVARTTIGQTISGRVKSERIQNRICAVLGMSIKEIWPDQIRLRRSRSEINANRARATA